LFQRALQTNGLLTNSNNEVNVLKNHYNC